MTKMRHMVTGGIDYDDPYQVRERLRQLEAALRHDDWVPLQWELTPTHIVILNLLADRRGHPVHRERIETVLYGSRPDGGPRFSSLSVFIHQLRRRLQPFHIRIENRAGQGWFLDAHSLAIINTLRERSE